MREGDPAPRSRPARPADRHPVPLRAASSWYREPAYPPYIAERSTNELADQLVTELTAGADGTDVRAGFVGEIGTERSHITPAQERVFRAAARAHRRTGCPILTHTTHFGELALEQLDLLAEEGVTAERVIVSHLGDRRDPAPLLAVAEAGPWLSVDNLAFVAGYAPLEVRADNVALLWHEGFGDRVLLGNDVCEVGQLAANGGPGYGNVLERFWPLLQARGVTVEQFRTMTVDNPAQAFAYPAGQRIEQDARSST